MATRDLPLKEIGVIVHPDPWTETLIHSGETTPHLALLPNVKEREVLRLATLVAPLPRAGDLLHNQENDVTAALHTKTEAVSPGAEHRDEGLLAVDTTVGVVKTGDVQNTHRLEDLGHLDEDGDIENPPAGALGLQVAMIITATENLATGLVRSRAIPSVQLAQKYLHTPLILGEMNQLNQTGIQSLASMIDRCHLAQSRILTRLVKNPSRMDVGVQTCIKSKVVGSMI